MPRIGSNGLPSGPIRDRHEPATVQQPRVDRADPYEDAVVAEQRKEQLQRRTAFSAPSGPYARRANASSGDMPNSPAIAARSCASGSPRSSAWPSTYCPTESRKNSAERERKRSSSSAGTTHASARSAATIGNASSTPSHCAAVRFEKRFDPAQSRGRRGAFEQAVALHRLLQLFGCRHRSLTRAARPRAPRCRCRRPCIPCPRSSSPLHPRSRAAGRERDAIFSRIAGMCEASFGRSTTIVASTFTIS